MRYVEQLRQCSNITKTCSFANVNSAKQTLKDNAVQLSKSKKKVPILVYIEHKGTELIPDSRQSACR